MVQSIVQKRVQCLIDGGLKLLALDFDLTICSVHTRGVYMGTEEDLNRCVCMFVCVCAMVVCVYMFV